MYFLEASPSLSNVRTEKYRHKQEEAVVIPQQHSNTICPLPQLSWTVLTFGKASFLLFSYTEQSLLAHFLLENQFKVLKIMKDYSLRMNNAFPQCAAKPLAIDGKREIRLCRLSSHVLVRTPQFFVILDFNIVLLFYRWPFHIWRWSSILHSERSIFHCQGKEEIWIAFPCRTKTSFLESYLASLSQPVFPWSIQLITIAICIC